MKRIFFIDFENVGGPGLKGISLLSEADEVVLFYSEVNAGSIAFISELRRDFHYIKILRPGQNSLDFQLSSYLGFRINDICRNEVSGDTYFFIISKDNGFDFVIDFWTNNEITKRFRLDLKILRSDSIYSALNPKALKTMPKIELSVPSYAKKATVEKIMQETSTFIEFHNALIREYGNPIGSELYRANKGWFKSLKGL
jgi:hypothetical protein